MQIKKTQSNSLKLSANKTFSSDWLEPLSPQTPSTPKLKITMAIIIRYFSQNLEKIYPFTNDAIRTGETVRRLKN